MKKIALIAAVAGVVSLLAPTVRSDTQTLTLVRVQVSSPAQARALMARFDETHNHTDELVELLLWPGDKAALDATGLPYTVVHDDLVAYDLERRLTAVPRVVAMPGPDYDDYRRLADYNTEMAQLAKDHPELVELFEMKRPSLEGRPIYGLEIAANVGRRAGDGRPVYYVDGVHHAREWPASEYTMLFAHHLVEGYGKDQRITDLLQRVRVIVVPIVNVDGFNYSRESVLSLTQPLRDATSLTGAGNGFEGYWRKNRRSLTGLTLPVVQVNPDAYGVDPNRNYSYLWGDQNGGSSGNQLDQTYRGAAPFSEPETRNVRDIILRRNVTGVITNHTYQGSVLRAGGGKAPDDALLVRIGNRIARALDHDNRPTVGYPTTGTTDDWAYAAIGALGFTIEHGRLGFHPPYSQSVQADFEKVMEGFTIMAEATADPRYHSVLSGKVTAAGRPAKARLVLTKTFKTPLSPGNPTGKDSVTEKVRLALITRPDGSFTWHINPSTRPYVGANGKIEAYRLTVTAGGRSKTLRLVIERGERLDIGTIRL